jgi:hypothetical protein
MIFQVFVEEIALLKKRTKNKTELKSEIKICFARFKDDR